MDQLTDMGFTRELAAEALAATGGKSTLKATEWILNQRKVEQAGTGSSGRQQARVDHFFTASSSVRVLEASQPLGEVEGDAVEPPKKIIRKGKEVVSSLMIGDGAEVFDLKKQQPEVLEPPQKKQQLEAFEPPQKKKALEGLETPPKKKPLEVPEPPQKKQQVPQPQQQQQKQHQQRGSGDLPHPKKQKQEPEQPKPAPLKNSAKHGKSMVPLAERMRPGAIDDIVGQDHLLGPKGILRSLLEGDLLPSVVLWGPPGTGKTTLARAIASTVSYRFVALSAVTSGVKEVREVLEEGKKSKKYGQRTLLFLDEVHRFNKAQQDAFLPYVEAGHVVFIGATTENPSFEINAALLSRCKVLTLNKLQPEHIQTLIERAVSDKEKGVIISAGIASTELLRVEDAVVQFLAGAADGDARVALNTLEIAVLAAASRLQKGSEGDVTTGGSVVAAPAATASATTTAPAAPAPAAPAPAAPAPPAPAPAAATTTATASAPMSRRESFNILEVLKENVQHSQEEYTRPFKKFVGGKNVTRAPAAATALDEAGPSAVKENSESDSSDKTVVVVTLVDAREALQRSHLYYDKTGEEHYNIISALHKSMRGGDADAAIYWLARMLEGGEGPLYVARRLVRFASEDVGLADPQALQQAVACYQACHFLGMPECNVHLAQCATYLALAPKSVVVYQAIEAAQRLIRDSRGQNEPVPLHLRNAPTGLMKELGYGKGYIYPPSQTGQVEQEYMPPSLRGHKFLNWPETTPR